jgi:DMSO reductase anchor subunit
MSRMMIQAMDKNEEYGALVAFTTLAPLAVGGLAGLLLATSKSQAPGLDWAAVLILAVGLLALAASLFHLGRPWRAPLALLRVGTSWLSREVLLFGLFLLTLAIYVIIPVKSLGSLVRNLVGIVAVMIGLFGTIATGETYHLHSHPSWDQWLAVVTFPLGALSAGSLFGFSVAYQFSGHADTIRYFWVGVAILLMLNLIVTWLRTTLARSGTMEGLLSRKVALGSYRWLLVVRIVAGIIALGLVGIGGRAQFLAWIPALLGEFADRILFFDADVPVTLRGRYI